MEYEFVERPGGRVAYQRSGQGELTVIWLHGLPLDSSSWEQQRLYFDQHTDNIWLDLRGYGRSDKIPRDTPDVTALYVEDIAALVDALELTRIALVGFASAGHVAMRYAAIHRDQVAKLIVINGSPRFRRGPGWPWGFDEAGIAHFVDAGRKGGIEAITDAVLDRDLVFRDLSPADATEVQQWFRTMSLRAGLDTLLGFFEGIAYDDDRRYLALIEADTLLLVSTMGQEVPSAVGLYLRQHIRRSRLVELPSADHFVFATRPQLTNLLIAQHLLSVSELSVSLGLHAYA
ncbi:hypothetical protein BWI15_00135 [Kribbella sp. ALI-6-A]|uniref:alpha/beta fold hydrolase n=1 Tax=Kribbella sp. ALI-6-A TaxID=1933817 RepID=UPI00097C2268|nr:alpha/beta hydrolase [Kribbella sp. ALI-6-A]ONI79088.1 hypothetical protein BWI15_00135 [Kribbella sp. ALI-6-A]